MTKQEELWLVVDGYNVIGSSREEVWQSSKLAEERDLLIRNLSDYQTMTEKKVFVVFDAHHTTDRETKTEVEQLTVFFTDYKETADQLIERFVREHKAPGRQIYVATSDYLEQRMIFGQGAYRISSRELLDEMAAEKKKINKKTTEDSQKITIYDQLSTDTRNKLENWRRKK